jgi:hypothetical protein
MEKLFIITPVPHAWTAKMNFHPNEFFWDDVSIPKEINAEYTLSIKYLRMKKMSVDYFYSTPIISEKFKSLCDEFNVNCQFVPIKIWVNAWLSEKKFYFLLLRDFISVVDADKSIFEFVRDRNTGNELYWPNFQNMPMFEKITNFVLKSEPTPHFFMAPEIGSKVCTAQFKEGVEKLALQGINFKEITPDFIYDPFSFISRPTKRIQV